MNPEAIGYIVGSVFGIAVCIGLLVLMFKVMKMLARALKPAAVVLGLLLVAGLVGIPLAQGNLSPQQKDQITKFFESLVDQARGVSTSSAQADQNSPSSESITEQPDEVFVTVDEIFVPSDEACEACNPRIDLSACVKR